MRDVLYKFHESQYAACLKLLDEMKVHVYYVNRQTDFVLGSISAALSCPVPKGPPREEEYGGERRLIFPNSGW